jgi:ABC-type glycerol-3-phosphate transport system substrate-binding protein
MTTKRTAALAIMLALVTVLAACGSSSSKSSNTTTTKAAKKTTTTAAPADPAAVTAEIVAAFNAYLVAPDLNAQLSYIDKGQTLATVQPKFNAATAGVKLPVQVVNLKTTIAADGKTAKFTYDLAGLPSGTVLLANQSGGAVLQSNGKWLLDRNTICDLGAAGAPQYADECLTAASS